MTKRTVLKNLKPYTAILAICVLLYSCQAFKPAITRNQPNNTNRTPFLENISIAPSGSAVVVNNNRDVNLPVPNGNYRFSTDVSGPFYNIEYSLPKQFKYAILLDVEVERLNNLPLVNYIDDWWGIPYRYGGLSREGIDCSAFVQGLLASVYGVSLPRVAREQKSMCESIADSGLKEGDLVFFNTRGGISHVGIYLQNNKFVHASVSYGVTISDLNDVYWEKRYLGAGRPKTDVIVRN